MFAFKQGILIQKPRLVGDDLTPARLHFGLLLECGHILSFAIPVTLLERLPRNYHIGLRLEVRLPLPFWKDRVGGPRLRILTDKPGSSAQADFSQSTALLSRIENTFQNTLCDPTPS